MSATLSQCPTGGEVYTVEEFDGNGDAVASSESVSIICNGANGTNGGNGTNGTSVVFTTVSASIDQCSNGGNVLIMASDTDGTGVYEATDANQESVLVCNGANGAQGARAPSRPLTPWLRSCLAVQAQVPGKKFFFAWVTVIFWRISPRL